MLKLTMERAVARLQEGGLLLYPTETFFGIGCKAGEDAAVARIFRVKRRLFAMPLPVILADAAQLSLAAQVPDLLLPDVERLIAAFWPGPLSLILPARRHFSPLLTGGTGNIAVRVSAHPVPCELAKRLGEPLVASSANISGKPAAILAEDIDPELLQAVGAVLDLAPLPQGGAPSTLVQPLGNGLLKLHRSGAVEARQLQEAGFGL